jgi:putative transcriptional regulator
MDLWAVHVKNTTGSPFCLRNHSIPEKSFVSSNFGKFRVLKHKISSSGYHSLGVKAMAKKNSNDNSNSSSPSPSGAFFLFYFVFDIKVFIHIEI